MLPCDFDNLFVLTTRQVLALNGRLMGQDVYGYSPLLMTPFRRAGRYRICFAFGDGRGRQ